MILRCSVTEYFTFIRIEHDNTHIFEPFVNAIKLLGFFG